MNATPVLEPAIAPDVMADLADAARYAASGRRDPAVMRQAAERMDRMREELRQQVGEIEVAVDLIRQTRAGA